MLSLLSYSKELLLCLRLGADFSSKMRLAPLFLTFHAANGLKLRPKRSERTYAIQLKHTCTPVTVRSYSGDVFIILEVLGSKCYRMPEPVERGGVVVDLGANIGIASLFLADSYEPTRLICVEPSADNCVLLRKNLSGLRQNVDIVQAAISNETGFVRFDTKAETWGGRISNAGERVPSLTMTDLVEHYNLERIDILKIDIEGAERLLFQSNLDWLKRVNNIAIEIHDGFSIADLKSALTPYGFSVWAAGENGNPMIVAVRNQSRHL
jgi:FkbM family methyltransferase